MGAPASYGKLFDRNFKILEDYVAEHGTTAIPQAYVTADGIRLGRWLYDQRLQARESMPVERRRRFEGLPGWSWKTKSTVPEIAFDRGLAALKTYVASVGAIPPSSYVTGDGYALGGWCGAQRRRRDLSPERRQALESVEGWYWTDTSKNAASRSESAFERGFSHLEAWCTAHGNAVVPARHIADDGYALGNWSRMTARSRRLHPQQRARLESLPGWTWATPDYHHLNSVNAFERGFTILLAYMARTGTAYVRRFHVEENGFNLGSWCAEQRQRRRKSAMTDDQVRRLEALSGWDWSLVQNTMATNLERIKSYAHRHGHARPPLNFKDEDGYPLGNWLASLRRNRHRVTAEECEMLELLPEWSWAPHVAAWQKGLDRLKLYIAVHGHANVPYDYKDPDGYSLANWVKVKRDKRKTLTAEQESLLDRLPGWRWNTRIMPFERGIEVLKAYVGDHGHPNVPRGYSKNRFALGRWVLDQRYRKDELTPTQIATLEAIEGWRWGQKSSHTFEAGVALLRAFLAAHGNIRVPKDHKVGTFHLYSWKRNKERYRNRWTPEQIAILEAFPGWRWRVSGKKTGPRIRHDNSFEYGLSKLKDFAVTHGHARVQAEFVDDSKFPLSRWCRKQDRLHLAGKLSPLEIAALEALPGWTWRKPSVDSKEIVRLIATFVAQNGHARIPTSHVNADGVALGKLVAQLRNRRMTDARRIKLESFPGWSWSPHEDAWNKGFGSLKRFVAETGHAQPRRSYCDEDGFPLGAWVAQRRLAKSHTAPERQAALEALPQWSWSSNRARASRLLAAN